MEAAFKTQACFGAQQKASSLLRGISKSNAKTMMELRRVTTHAELEDRLVREIYILEYSNLEFAPKSRLKALAKRAKVMKYNPEMSALPDDPKTLVWLIAMTIVREKIPYHFSETRFPVLS